MQRRAPTRTREWIAIAIVAATLGAALIRFLSDDPASMARQTRVQIRVDPGKVVAQTLRHPALTMAGDEDPPVRAGAVGR